MKLNPKIYLFAVILFAVFVGFILTAPDSIFERQFNNTKFNYLFHKTLNTKKLTAITHNNSTGYFIYKGTPMGFHYDLLKEYCKAMGFHLSLIVEDDLDKALKMVGQGKAEILAVDLTYTKPRKKLINFTVSHGYNHQVLLQRKPNKKDSTDFISAVLDLDGKNVYIQKGTVFKDQLEYLQEQTGADFNIIEDPKNSMEDLILMVSEGKIDYTACDERQAMAMSKFLSNIDFSLQISAKQKLCWAVPPYEDSLKISINKWLTEFKKTKRFNQLQRKYFSSKKTDYQTDFDFLPARGGNLTPFDNEIKENASKIGWDWRLLASLLYQESRFNPQTVSWAGAIGLMQIMPETGLRMGVQDINSVEGNIKAGTKFLVWLDKQFALSVPDSNERIKFVLAAYNCGLGHIQDAQRLALKNGKDQGIWLKNTAKFLLLKSQKKYYHDPVVKFGFCRGNQTYDFVNEILERYHDYQNLVEL